LNNPFELFIVFYKKFDNILNTIKTFTYVATLTLGLRPKQGLARARAKREAQESHFMLPRVWENVRMNIHTPK
jgi:hypothetical protein